MLYIMGTRASAPKGRLDNSSPGAPTDRDTLQEPSLSGALMEHSPAGTTPTERNTPQDSATAKRGGEIEIQIQESKLHAMKTTDILGLIKEVKQRNDELRREVTRLNEELRTCRDSQKAST